MTFTTFSLSSTLSLNTRAAAQPVLTTTTPSMSSFAAIPILGYSVLALVFSYIVQRIIRIVNFRNLLSRSSSATSSSSSNSSLETLPTTNAASEPKKSRIPVPSWDLTPFKKTTANAYRKASALLPSRGNSVELLPTHVASPPPTAALVDYGVFTEQQSAFQTPATPLPFPPTPPLTSSPSPGTSTTSPGPRTPSPAHHSHSPFSAIPLRIPLPTPFSLFPGPYVPLQPQPKSIISPNRPRTPSPPFLATTPPPTTAHRRSKSLGGVPVRKVANSRLGLAFPHAEAEVEMRDLYRTSKDAPLIDFSSSSEGEEDQDDEDVGVFGRRKRAASSLVPGGPLESVSMPLVDLSDTTRAEGEEDVFGFKTGVTMSRRRSIGGDVEVELVALKRDVERLPLPPKNLAHASGNNNALIDIDPSITEEKLVDVDTSSSKTISPMEPVVLSVGTSRVVSREASPVPGNVEPLVHLPVVEKAFVQAPVAQLPVVAPDSVLDEAVVPAAESVESQEEGGEELVHVGYEDAVHVVVGEEKGNEEDGEEEREEEEEGVLVDVSPHPVDVEASLPEVGEGSVAEVVDVDVDVEPEIVDVEVSAVEVVDVEVSAPEVVDAEVSQPEVVDLEVSRPVDVEVSAPEVVEAPLPKTTDVLLVDVHASPEPTKPANLPQDQDQDTSEHKPMATAWQWDEEDDMMRAWSLGLDLVDAPLSLPLPLDADVHPLRNGDVSLLDEKPPYDLLIQQEPEPESPPTSVENSPPLPLLPPLTIPLITISDTKRSPEEEYPDPELLPLPDFDFSISTKEEKEKRSPPSQTPTPPDSPPSSPGGLGVVKSTPRTAPSSPLGLRPAWSLRAADAPPLGLSSSSSSSTPLASPLSSKKGGVALLTEEEVEEVRVQEETDTEVLPGSFPDSQAPSSSSNTTTTTTTPATTSIKTISALINTPDTQRIRVSRSPLDIALAMQLRPGLGLGADPAWMVRFLMAMFGWFAILVSGQGEF